MPPVRLRALPPCPPPGQLRAAVASPWLQPGSRSICLGLCPQPVPCLFCTDPTSRGHGRAVPTEGTGALCAWGVNTSSRGPGAFPPVRGLVGQPAPHPRSSLLLESGLWPHPGGRLGEQPSGRPRSWGRRAPEAHTPRGRVPPPCLAMGRARHHSPVGRPGVWRPAGVCRVSSLRLSFPVCTGGGVGPPQAVRPSQECSGGSRASSAPC